jgi:hypothetical protein
MQLFHADREVLQSQLVKLNFHTENSSPREQHPSSLGAVSLDNAGTDGLDNASQWSSCTSLDTIRLFHNNAVDSRLVIRLFSEDPTNTSAYPSFHHLEEYQEYDYPEEWENLASYYSVCSIKMVMTNLCHSLM